MLSAIEFAHQIFEELSVAIDHACEERYWFTACRPARVLGFSQHDVSTSEAYRQCYALCIEPDLHLCLIYHADTAFSGVTRFELTLRQEATVLRTYHKAFEEVAPVRKVFAAAA